MITYSIANDTLNGVFDPDSFLVEIQTSSIVPSVDVFAVVADEIQISFKAALSGAEQITLDGLVSAHTGEPYEEPQTPYTVTFEQINETNHVPHMAVVEADGTFNTYVTHNFANNATWPAVDDSCWTLVPPMGTRYRIKRAEVQFQHDIVMNGVTQIHFDVWVYNPADLPNKVLYERKTYSSIMDVMNVGNMHCTMPAVDGMTSSLTTVQFDYPRAIVLDPAIGAEIRVCTEGDVAIQGTFCTISFVVGEEPI